MLYERGIANVTCIYALSLCDTQKNYFEIHGIFKETVFVKFISVKGERKEHYVKYLIYNAFLNTFIHFHLGMHCSMLMGLQRVKAYQNLDCTSDSSSL